MKKILQFSFVLFAFFGCKKETEQQPVEIPVVDLSKLPLLTNGQLWVVKSLTEVKAGTTTENAKMFAEVSLMFFYDKTIMAHNGPNMSFGTWKNGESVKYGQAEALSAYTFTINLGIESPYNQISDQWILKEISEKQVKFDHSNPAEKKQLLLVKQ